MIPEVSHTLSVTRALVAMLIVVSMVSVGYVLEKEAHLSTGHGY